MPQPSRSTDGRRSRRIDVRAERVAAVYAQSLLGAAENAGQTAAISQELSSLVSDVLDKHPDFERLLASAIVPHEQKSALLDRVLGKLLAPLLIDFLKVVSRHGRLGVLREVQAEFQKQFDSLRGRTPVMVATATPLSESLSGSLTASLRGSLHAEPLLETVVDPELIGGIVLRVGDTVYDGSLASQLALVREQMIYRSVHEIQSRRDRFRSASGN